MEQGKDVPVEVGKKYWFRMQRGMNRWGTVRQILPDAYVITLCEPLVVAPEVLESGSQCLVALRLVTGVEEVL